MKSLKSFGYIGILALAILGAAMAITNPDEPSYEQYAVEQLTTYLTDDVCSQVPKAFENLVKNSCASIVDSSRPEIQQVISRTTQRQNFILFSIYHTDLSISPAIPFYRFQTVGVMQNFYTYSAQKQ